MEDRVTQIIQDSAKLTADMFDAYSHRHQWLSQYVSFGNSKLFYTGNLVCDCGAIVWRDEMETIMNIASTLPQIRLFGLRGNSPSIKSAQHCVQLTASGAGWHERLGKYLICLGFRIANSGGN